MTMMPAEYSAYFDLSEVIADLEVMLNKIKMKEEKAKHERLQKRGWRNIVIYRIP